MTGIRMRSRKKCSRNTSGKEKAAVICVSVFLSLCLSLCFSRSLSLNVYCRNRNKNSDSGHAGRGKASLLCGWCVCVCVHICVMCVCACVCACVCTSYTSPHDERIKVARTFFKRLKRTRKDLVLEPPVVHPANALIVSLDSHGCAPANIAPCTYLHTQHTS